MKNKEETLPQTNVHPIDNQLRSEFLEQLKAEMIENKLLKTTHTATVSLARASGCSTTCSKYGLHFNNWVVTVEYDNARYNNTFYYLVLNFDDTALSKYPTVSFRASFTSDIREVYEKM